MTRFYVNFGMISTTKMGELMGWSSKETFVQLVEWGLIVKESDVWTPTPSGLRLGAKMMEHPIYGMQLKWSPKTDLRKFEVQMAKDLMTASKIGEHFNVSGQKINKILSELGWVEQDIEGWIVTQLGRNKGGVNLEASSGKMYAKWGVHVLEDPGMLGWLKPSATELVTQPELDVEDAKVAASDRERLNARFPASIITQDGHCVRSLGEKTIDDYLYMNKIVHAYERPLKTPHGNCVPDFYIPSGVCPGSHAVFIEYWGMEGKPEYDERKKKKLDIYESNNMLKQLIQISPSHMSDLDSELGKQLLKRAKISVL